MRRRRISIVSVLMVALALSACGPKTFHTSALISDQLSQGLLTAQSAVKAANEVGAMTPETYLGLQKRFEQLGVVGLAVNQALRDGNQQAAITQVAAALQVVDAVLEVDLLKVKPEQRQIISIALVGVKATLLAYASILGGGGA